MVFASVTKHFSFHTLAIVVFTVGFSQAQFEYQFQNQNPWNYWNNYPLQVSPFQQQQFLQTRIQQPPRYYPNNPQQTQNDGAYQTYENNYNNPGSFNRFPNYNQNNNPISEAGVGSSTQRPGASIQVSNVRTRRPGFVGAPGSGACPPGVRCTGKK